MQPKKPPRTPPGAPKAAPAPQRPFQAPSQAPRPAPSPDSSPAPAAPSPSLPSLPSLQDMPSPQARFCLGLERFLRAEPGLDLTGRTVLVAFSGGVDSTVLLAALAALAPRLGLRLAAAHLDHALRPESAAEAERARAFCVARAIPCTTAREDVAARAAASGTGIEEAARAARYAFLDRALAEHGADLLALGHTLNDLAEDVLMRLTRGTGWPQLAGMTAWDPARRLIRPLLLTPRKDVAAFATALALPWTEDPSNQEPGCLRNRMRHDVLPLLLQENPNFLAAAATLWRSARLDRADFEADTAALLLSAQPATNGATLLPAALLDSLSPARRLRLFKSVLEDLGPGQALADSLFRLERAWNETRESGRVIQFPGPKLARVSPKGVALQRDDE